MKKNGTATADTLGGLKEIREIIFGEALDQLQKQIDDLKSENSTLLEQLRNHENNSSKTFSELTTKHESEINKTNEIIDKLKNELESKIKELNLSKLGKNQIGQAFIEWGTKVKQDDNS